MGLTPWTFIKKVGGDSGLTPGSSRVCVEAAKEFDLKGIELVGRQHLPEKVPKRIALTEVFIGEVHQELSRQPWPRHIHMKIATKLNAKSGKVYAAIRELIARGKWLPQRGGVLYDREGLPIAGDAAPGEPGDSTPRGNDVA